MPEIMNHYAEASKEQRLAKYLAEYVGLSSKTTYDLASYEHDPGQVIWLHSLPAYADCRNRARANGSDDGLTILTIKQPKVEQPPALPAVLSGWIDEKEMLDPFGQALLLPDSKLVSHPTEPSPATHRIYLDDNPKVQAAFTPYSNRWTQWSERRRHTEPIRDAYRRLFGIERTLRVGSELYELVLCIGCVDWQGDRERKQPRIARHVLAIPATVDLNTASGSINVSISEDSIRFAIEDEMLEATVRPAGRHRERFDECLEKIGVDPWNSDDLHNGLREWALAIHPEAQYYDGIERDRLFGAAPRVAFAPALVLRRRTRHAVRKIYSSIADAVADGETCSDGWKELVSIPDDAPVSRTDSVPKKSQDDDQEMFFPLPANSEQEKIVRFARRGNGVLVQGPPGTGKSHTIANLICHLLATGQRVLVTAETSRALSVLKDKIPDDLKPLCVSLLDGGRESNEELAKSVNEITRRHSSWSQELNAHDVVECEQTLDGLRREIASCNEKIRSLRSLEVEQVSLGSGQYGGTPSAIARNVAADSTRYDWLSVGRSEQEAPRPAQSDVYAWLTTCRELDNERATELGLDFPDPTDLPSANEFSDLVDVEKRLGQECEQSGPVADPAFHAISNLSADDRTQLRNEFHDLAADVDAALRPESGWSVSAFTDVVEGDVSVWSTRLADTKGCLDMIEQFLSTTAALKISAPTSRPLEAVRGDVAVLLEHFNAGGGWKRAGIVTPRPVRSRTYIRDEARIEGSPVATADQLSQLDAHLSVVANLDRLRETWAGTSAEFPSEPQSIEIGRFKGMRLQLENLLAACKKCRSQDERLTRADSSWARTDWLGDRAKRGLALIDAADDLACFRSTRQEIESLFQRLEVMSTNTQAHSLTGVLAAAARNRDVPGYRHALSDIGAYRSDRRRLDRSKRTEENLDLFAPGLTSVVREEPDDARWDERFATWDRACEWAHSKRWLNDGLDSESMERICVQREKAQQQIWGITAKLASLRAWDAFFARLTNKEVQALRSWQAAQKKIGKGTGRSAGATRARREARIAMENCRDAIPAWIMPKHQVAELMEKPTAGRYDYVIADEASQLGIDSLFLFFIAKHMIVVGDDQQISPSDIGVPQDDVEHLQKEHLDGIAHLHEFGPQSSLYSNARIRFRSTVVLREHFRCMPEIIQFSNDLCYAPYGQPLIPMRTYTEARLDPVITKYVPDGYRSGSSGNAVNRPEAKAIVQAISVMVNDPKYSAKSIGVISLQANAQAKEIEQELVREIGLRALEKHKIVCGDAYAFQGDERDVMFLSMVAAIDGDTSVRALTTDSYVQRFNVAASRARDQLWLFHSVRPEDLSPKCLRTRLLKYMLSPSREITDPEHEQFESNFERDVYGEIVTRGYRVTTQFPAGDQLSHRYRIDLVVEGMDRRLAVECDGDEWHGPEQFEYDMARQRDLERAGWQFFRVRGSAFYSDPVVALEPLWEKLDRLEILPHMSTEPTSESATEELPPEDVNSNGSPSVELVQPVAAPVPPHESNRIAGSTIGADQLPPDPRKASLLAVADFLSTMIDENGPMVVRHAFEVYLRACSINRMGGQIRERMERALQNARARELVQVVDELRTGDTLQCVVRSTGAPPVSLRKKDGRDFHEIPPSEVLVVTKMVEEMGFELGSDDFIREVLSHFEVKRLTSKARERIETILTTDLTLD